MTEAEWATLAILVLSGIVAVGTFMLNNKP